MPTEAGQFVWNVKVTDKENRTPETCTIAYRVNVKSDMTVTTTALPDAYADTIYRASLSAVGFTSLVKWKYAENTRRVPGIDISEDGTLKGSVSSEDLLGEPSRTFSFLVQGRDVEGRVAEASLSITVYREQPKPEGPNVDTKQVGCSAGGVGVSWLGLALGLGLAARRRRG